MFKSVSILLIKVIDKLLSAGKLVKVRGGRENVLISYVLAPPVNIPFYFKTSHNNKYQCYLLIKYFRSKGYNVYLYDYLNEAIDYSVHYDVFVGHNKTFVPIGKKLRQPVKAILLGTGSNPKFGNDQQRLRIQDVNRRKNVNLDVLIDNIVPDLTHSYEAADVVLLMGNNFVMNTYDQRFHKKIRLINNVTLHPFFQRQRKKRNNNFLFVSSTGQVHRGLDLLLDVFVNRPNKLYVLSAFKSEKEFVNAYQKELYETPNIHALGYVDLSSTTFKKVIEDVDFVILPSCSEGQSSSVVNMMMYGLIPIVPDNAGLTGIDETGITIETLDITGVVKAVEQAVQLTDDEIARKRMAISSQTSLYQADAFLSRLDETIQADLVS